MSPAEESAEAPHLERLQKVLAAAGLASRRACEEYIQAGRVTVDGATVTQLGVRVDPDRQKVAVDGELLKPQRKRYYVVNKPQGCLCTSADPSGRPRVIDLLPPSETRLFTVGRLDENTEGLLLVTNDGELANRLAHPRFQVERVYRVQVAGVPSPETLRQLQQGIFFTEGKFRMRDVRRLKTRGQSALLEIVLTEGQNREVRRMFARVGHKVMALKRIAFGPLKLADLLPGGFRPLRPDELEELQRFVRGERIERPRRPAHGRPTRRPSGGGRRPTERRPGPAAARGPRPQGDRTPSERTQGERPRPARPRRPVRKKRST